MIEPATKSSFALVGFASSSRELAPFNDPDWDVGILNELYKWAPRWDFLWEMHNHAHVVSDRLREGQQVKGSDHYDFLKALPGPGTPGHKPVFMQQHFPDIPASEEFPVKELAEKFYPGEEAYFTSTPAYMMAWAIERGYKRIGCYGIDLLQDEEYAYQKPCMEYLIGVARGKGIEVIVPKQSSLLKAGYLYGFTEPPTKGGALANFRQFLKDQAARHKAQFNNVEATRHTLNGVLQVLESCDSWIGHLERGGVLTAPQST